MWTRPFDMQSCHKKSGSIPIQNSMQNSIQTALQNTMPPTGEKPSPRPVKNLATIAASFDTVNYLTDI
jgi:hypothetical protein